jgi:hypothetical protein
MPSTSGSDVTVRRALNMDFERTVGFEPEDFARQYA